MSNNTTNTKAAAAETATNKPITVVTHNGVFHADEVLACAVLRLVRPECAIVRTRDDAAIRRADYVVDVGGAFDPSVGMYDHHQTGGAGERANGIPFAAAGLVWRQFGATVVARQLAGYKLDCPRLDDVVTMVDRDLIAGVDAHDCGYRPKSNEEGPRAMSVSTIVSQFNPSWLQASSPDEFDLRFNTALGVVDDVLFNTITSAIAAVAAEDVVIRAAAAAEGGIMVLERFVPWSPVAARRSSASAFEHVDICVFPSVNGGWNAQAVPAVGGGGSKLLFPPAWRGLAGEALETVIEPGAVFCHKAGFIAGHKTKDGAMAMARQAIAEKNAG